MKKLSIIIASVLAWLSGAPQMAAQGTAFTYQGLLNLDGAGPANGLYEIAFRPFDVATGGSPLAVSVNRLVTVSNGLFTTTMDFGAAFFDGGPRFLQLEVRTNGTVAFAILAPRQQLTPVPYSIFSSQAGTVPAGSITTSKLAPDSVSAAALQNNAVLGSKIANGQVVRSINGLQDTVTLAAGTNTTLTTNGNTLTLAGSSDWKLGGNTGTQPGTHFIGTTDFQPLEFKAGGQRALRLEPTGDPDTVNVIGGSARNFVAPGKVGATIGGGGTGDYQGNVYTNQVGGNFGTVAGGIVNTILLNADFATVGGGAANVVQTNGLFATIPGGRENSAADYAFAAGRRAKANHTGAFVWADSQDANFPSSASNQFLIRAAGNVGINKTNPAATLDVNGTIAANNFTGNGAGLTALNASQLTSGAIGDSRLSPNVALLNANQNFTGSNYFAGALVATNTNNRFVGNGTGLSNVNALFLDGFRGSNLWTTMGNAGAFPGLNFIGTTDNQPLEFRVNNQRALRLQPTGSNDTVNVIGGSARNFVGPGVVGATIAGGGSGEYFGAAYTNQVEADFSTISGGRQNSIQSTAYSGTVGGGQNNSIQNGAFEATIGGGHLNTMLTNATSATIGGGFQNTIDGYSSTISGGRGNFIQAFADRSSIGGGGNNTIVGSLTLAVCGTIAGGFQNTIQTNTSYSTIGGGAGNTIQPNVLYATIPGGESNNAAQHAFAAGRRAKATHTGAFVWADSQNADFTSTGINQFLIRAAGGVAIGTNNPNGAALAVNGLVTATSFSGDGASVTGLNATNLVGTISSARLSTNVALRGGGNAFAGDQTISAGRLGIGTLAPTRPLEVQTPGDVEIGLKSTDVNGRLWTLQSSGNGTPGREQTFQIIDRTAGASRLLINNNGNVGIGTSSPSTKLEVNGTITAGSDVTEGFVARGAAAGYALYDRVPADEDDHWVMFASGGTLGFYNALPRNTVLSVSSDGDVTARSLNGTAGTPLEFKVNNQRALRLEPGPGGGVNVIGGWAGNYVDPFVTGATIGGGGAGNYNGFALSNHVAESFGTVSGGAQNTVSSPFSTIGGGGGNEIQLKARYATVGGGDGNSIRYEATHGTIGGGEQNIINGAAGLPFHHATIGGGKGNTIMDAGYSATIGGGLMNTNSGGYATIPGGVENSAAGSSAFAAGSHAKADHNGSFVWADSSTENFASTLDDQFSIRARGGVRLSSNTPDLSFGFQTRQMLNLWGTNYGIGVQSDTLYFRCDTTPNGGFIWYKGGRHEDSYSQPGQGGAEMMHLVNDRLYLRGGAVVDQAGLNDGSVSSASLTFGTSSGEGIASKRTIGGNRFGLDFYAGGLNRMTILNNGNVGIGTTVPDSALTVNGSASKPGGGSWTFFSDARLKKNIRPLANVLDRLLALRGVTFEYLAPEKIHELSGERIGMIAQEVEAVFPDWVETGTDGYKRLTFRGFEALTVEALRELRAEKDAQILALEKQNTAQRAVNVAMEARLATLEKAMTMLTEKHVGTLAANPESASAK